MDEIDSIDATTKTNNILLENAKSFAAGGFGGVCAVMTGHPFDLIKVLLQTNQHKSAISAVKSTISTNGLLGLYKGVSSPLLGVTPMFAVSFWGYDVGKKLVLSFRSNKDLTTPMTITEISTAGFFSAIPTTLIAAPFERVKVVMQTQTTKSSFGATVASLYKTGGISSIFKGSAATLARDGPGSAVYFATYEILKKKLSKDDDSLSLLAISIAGGFAGVAMWTTIFPIDTIKSIQQSSAEKISMSQVLRKIYSTRGIGGFFPGIGPALARSFPANAATFAGVELAKKFLN